MSEQIRAAVWCALSTAEQVKGDDKKSMQDQLERCRKAVADKGWQRKTRPSSTPRSGRYSPGLCGTPKGGR